MEKDTTTKVTIWNEGRHEKHHPNVARIYPAGIHGAIAEGLKNEGFAIRTVDISELMKAEAAVTCSSVIFETPE